jgi:hypothetical protein
MGIGGDFVHLSHTPFERNVEPEPENRSTLVAFEPGEALFVDLCNMEEPRSSFHDLRDLLAVFVNLLAMFLSGTGEDFHGLRQGFVPLGQPIEALINRHRLPPQK